VDSLARTPSRHHGNASFEQVVGLAGFWKYHQGTDAMRITIFTIGLALFVGFGTLGCKSAPKLAWWKNSNKADVESSAVARSAPALPSEVAKEVEGFAAASNPTAIGGPNTEAPQYGSAAPAYSANTNSGAKTYPSTGAAEYLPNGSQQSGQSVAATGTGGTKNSTALPYNPDQVPPPSSSVAASSVEAPHVEKYPSTASSGVNLPDNANATAGSALSDSKSYSGYEGTGQRDAEESLAAASTSEIAPSYADTTNRQSSQLGAPTQTADSRALGTGFSPSSSQANEQTTTASNSGGSLLGDRYASFTTNAEPPANSSTSSEPPKTSVATNSTQEENSSTEEEQVEVASSQPYRPGGTSTYPGTGSSQPNYELATRPQGPNSTDNSGSDQQVPNVATPTSTQSAPQYR